MSHEEPSSPPDRQQPATGEPDGEPFHRADSFKVGILGGKGVGKSYLFQSIAYRTYAGSHAAALSHFLEKDATRLWRALQQSDQPEPLNIPRFLKGFTSWERLPQTMLLTQSWYRLRLSYRCGLLGRARRAVDVDFFDGSGEGLFEALLDRESRAIWGAGFLAARILVFCLPLWVAFPAPRLTDADWEERQSRLERFEQVVQNFLELRHHAGATTPIDCALALTMADDLRGGLASLRERWILRCLAAPDAYLRELRSARGLARYLANARQVSDLLHDRFAAASDPFVAAIPQKLDFGRGGPWLIPLSAIEGARLDQAPDAAARRAIGPPVPVHVELPLLLTLCASSNALM